MLVDSIRLVHRTTMQAAVRMIATCVMLTLPADIAVKHKIFGISPYWHPLPSISRSALAFLDVSVSDDFQDHDFHSLWRDVPESALH